MQKIKNSIVDRMIEQKCTSNEIDFLCYISMYQDITGRVTGVHYKDVCDATGMSIQGYYDTKASLEDKVMIISFIARSFAPAFRLRNSLQKNIL